MRADKLAYARSFAVQYRNADPLSGKRLVESYSDHEFVVQNPPAKPLTTAEMDAVYRLPYARAWHPDYDEAGGVPALSEVKFSLTSNRGCFGECAFCALTFHQGRIVSVRSHESLVEEARLITQDPAFKGYIHDVGGPTANFRAPACAKQLTAGACPDRRCLAPEPCPALKADHADYVSLLRKLRALPGVKKVFVRSGIRFDYVMLDSDRTFLRELVEHHVSGQLKVAPEHVSDAVLRLMGKPPRTVYDRFVKAYTRENERAHLNQFLVPYLMSSHPGSTLKEAVELAEYVRDMGYNPEQVQDFYPTPSTISTCMYYTGVDPRTMEKVYVPRSAHEKALQRALIQYRNPANYDLVVEALRRAGRTDLIGWGEKCLVRPRKPRAAESTGKAGKGSAAGRASRSGKGASRSGKGATHSGKGVLRPGESASRSSKGVSRSGKNATYSDKGASRSGKSGFRPEKGFAASAKGRDTRAKKTRGPIPKANGHKGGIRKGL